MVLSRARSFWESSPPIGPTRESYASAQKSSGRAAEAPTTEAAAEVLSSQRM
jgi:hypothetical protein